MKIELEVKINNKEVLGYTSKNNGTVIQPEITEEHIKEIQKVLDGVGNQLNGFLIGAKDYKTYSKISLV